jgi:hypothetical protein
MTKRTALMMTETNEAMMMGGQRIRYRIVIVNVREMRSSSDGSIGGNEVAFGGEGVLPIRSDSFPHRSIVKLLPNSIFGNVLKPA